MKTKVIEWIKKYDMIHDKDTVVAGVSGGADSVCLLFLLCQYKSLMDFNLEVVHINHMLRPSANEEEEYVKNLCITFENRFNIPLPYHAKRVDVKHLAEKSGKSTEEMGRIIRYEVMREVLGDRKGVIAVAHHANDRAETVLFNLFRGTAIQGLHGILPVNGNIIRPLLGVERTQIEEYLKTENLHYVIDESNLTDDYTRNKIRHNIITYAQENIVNSIVGNICNTATSLSKIEDFLMVETNKAMKRCCIRDDADNIVIKISDLVKEHDYIIDRILYEYICQIAGQKKDITSEHIAGIRQLLNKGGSKLYYLPYNIIVIKEYDTLTVKLNGEVEKTDTISVNMNILEKFNMSDIPKGNYTKWFDYDKISTVAKVRTRQTGDYFIAGKSGQKKYLKDFFINEKVPKEQRDSIRLLADDSHIMWVIGMRISEYYKVTEETVRVLEVSYERAD